jgi:hypothetical protein
MATLSRQPHLPPSSARASSERCASAASRRCWATSKSAVRDAAVVVEPTPGRFDNVAAGLAAALDHPQRIDNLIRASLRELSGRAEAAWRAEFRNALGQQHDLDLLEETVDVDRLLELFASTLWDELSWTAAKPGSPLAPLWEHTVLKRILDCFAVDHLPELSDAQIRDRFADYLVQVDARARQRPSPQHPAHIDPETLNQRVRMRTQPLRFTPSPHEQQAGVAYLPKGVDDSEAPETIVAWATIREQHSRMVVLGEPGYGKTWLLRSEAHRLASTGLDALKDHGDLDELPIPVWLRLDELAYALRRSTCGQRPMGAAVVEWLHREYRLSPRFVRWLGERIDNGPCVLLLDALDEVTDKADRTALAHTLPGWARTAGNSRVILTSRLAGYTGPPLDEHDVTTLELVPFSPAEVDRFITAWFKSAQEADRLRAQLRDNPAAQGMTRAPLLLTLLCILACDPSDPLPTRRAELYECVLWRFLARTHRPKEQRPTDIQLESTLELLAQIANTFAQRAGWIDLMPLSELLAAIRSAGAAYDELVRRGEAAQDIVTRLSQHDGVLVPAGDSTRGRSVPYLFLHRTIHEYLVARCLASQSIDALLSRLDDPDEDVRLAVAKALKGSSDTRVIDALLSHLNDRNPATHEAAAYVLAGSSDARVIDALLT